MNDARVSLRAVLRRPTWRVRRMFPVDHGQAFDSEVVVWAWTARGARKLAVADSPLNYIVTGIDRV